MNRKILTIVDFQNSKRSHSRSSSGSFKQSFTLHSIFELLRVRGVAGESRKGNQICLSFHFWNDRDSSFSSILLSAKTPHYII